MHYRRMSLPQECPSSQSQQLEKLSQAHPAESMLSSPYFKFRPAWLK